MEFMLLIFVALEISITCIICLRELCVNYFNSAPKFNSKIENSINNIEFIKLRSIQKFSQD